MVIHFSIQMLVVFYTFVIFHFGYFDTIHGLLEVFMRLDVGIFFALEAWMVFY